MLVFHHTKILHTLETYPPPGTSRHCSDISPLNSFFVRTFFVSPSFVRLPFNTCSLPTYPVFISLPAVSSNTAVSTYSLFSLSLSVILDSRFRSLINFPLCPWSKCSYYSSNCIDISFWNVFVLHRDSYPALLKRKNSLN